MSTHPCVSFPSGRNKNCLCFSRPFRKSYRAIIALLSNGRSLFRLSLLPLPTWALPLTPPCSLLGCSSLSSIWQPNGREKLLPACHFHYTHAYFHLETSPPPKGNKNNRKKNYGSKTSRLSSRQGFGDSPAWETPEALCACFNPAALIILCDVDWRSLHH